MTKTRLVVLDLDNTLLPSEALYEKGLHAAWKALSKSGRRMSYPSFRILYSRARADVKQQLKAVPSARNRTLYLKRLVERLEGRTVPQLVMQLRKAYDQAWASIPAARLRPFLSRLSKRYRVVLLTDQMADFQMAKLAKLDPQGQFFISMVTAEEVGSEKPNAQMFREACRRGGVSPRQAVMVGDSYASDILGARRAGLSAIYVSKSRKSLPSGVRQVSDLQALEKLLCPR